MYDQTKQLFQEQNKIKQIYTLHIKDIVFQTQINRFPHVINVAV